MKRKNVRTAFFGLLLAITHSVCQGADETDADPYAKENANLEEWALRQGIKIKMEGPIAEGVPESRPPQGERAIYDGYFKKNGRSWRIRRHAIVGNPRHGDILEIGWLDSDDDCHSYAKVVCQETIRIGLIRSGTRPRAIQERDIKRLLGNLP